MPLSRLSRRPRGGTTAPGSVAAMPHILVVEDDATVRVALLRALADRGYATSSAATAMAGLTAAVDGRPDLVVLDLGLPDLDGAEFLRMLRAVSTTPVIVATARD